MKLNLLNQKLNGSINDLQTAQNSNAPAAVMHTNTRKYQEFEKGDRQC